jgi:hypothetical protein
VDADRESALPDSWMPNLLALAGPLLSESDERFRFRLPAGRDEGLEAAVALAFGEDQTLP